MGDQLFDACTCMGMRLDWKLSEFKDEPIGSVGGSGYEFCRGRVSALGHT